MKFTRASIYKRQTTLSEIGEAGQKKISNTQVLIIGCGGLGSAAAVYLAGSGIGHIHLVDFDVISESNLPRQVFYKTIDIGKYKVEVLAAHLLAINPFIKVTYSNKKINKKNIFSVLSEYKIVLDCTDSLPIKYLINDACVLKDKILVYGSLYKFDGYVASYNLVDSQGKRSCNLRDAFPEISKNHIPNCSEIGTLNSIVGIIALLQANEVLKIVTQTGKPLKNILLIYNSLENSQYKMKLPSNFDKAKTSALFLEESYGDNSCIQQNNQLLITKELLKKEIQNSRDNLYILSVIEDKDFETPFAVDEKIPLSVFNPSKIKIPINKTTVIICKKGIMSYSALKLLKEEYPKAKVFSLKDGIDNF